MAEFTGGNEKYISAREPIVFENKTESKYEVCAGIVFHKSGIYEVSVVGNRTIVSEVPERKKGKWIKLDMHAHLADHKCSVCEQECYVPTCMGEPMYDFCPNCGARMTGNKE